MFKRQNVPNHFIIQVSDGKTYEICAEIDFFTVFLELNPPDLRHVWENAPHSSLQTSIDVLEPMTPNFMAISWEKMMFQSTLSFGVGVSSMPLQI